MNLSATNFLRKSSKKQRIGTNVVRLGLKTQAKFQNDPSTKEKVLNHLENLQL